MPPGLFANAAGALALEHAGNATVAPAVLAAAAGGSVSGNGIDYVDALVWGAKWDNTASTPITYSFNSRFLYEPTGQTTTTLSWDATEIAAVKGALDSYANVANITFQDVGPNNSSADLEFHDITRTQMILTFGADYLGLMFTADNAPEYNGWTGKGFFSSQQAGWHNAGLQKGGYGYTTIVHEIGHGLGLAHPHEDASDGAGVSTQLSASLDHGLNTVMSYNNVGQAWNPYTGNESNTFSTSWGTYGQTAGPMAFDIAALQHIYGANTSYNTGNNTYSLLTSRYEAIWDAGGSDTISAAGLSDGVTINLQEGTHLSSQSGSFGGYTIAYGADIENATGGSASDALTGNALANLLQGGAGADSLDGGPGTDTASYSGSSSGVEVNLMIGAGFGGDASGDSLLSIENLTGSAHNDTFTGDDGANRLEGGGGNDLLDGRDGGDTLLGGAGADLLFGRLGDDSLTGGAGDDTLEGGAGTDTASFSGAQAGYSTSVSGGVVTVTDTDGSNGDEGTDTLTGIETLSFSDGTVQVADLGTQEQPEVVQVQPTVESVELVTSGDAGDNTLSGDSGGDILSSLGGDDTLIGGGGVPVSLAADTASDGNAEGDTGVFATDPTDGPPVATPPQATASVAALDGQMQSLVNAMAAFAPPAAGQTSLPTSYEEDPAPVIAASWETAP